MLSKILNAANYESLCNFSIIPPEGKLFSVDFLQQSGNIFCKTDYIDYLFENIKHSKYNYNLITHHSDYPIDEQLFSRRPKCINKWYAINPTYTHPNLIAIPLGLKTHKGCYFEPQYMTEWFAYNIQRLRDNKKNKNIYCNWNITNLERNNISDNLISNDLDITLDTNIPFNKYIERMSQHKFVISPPGNGIDCHRTWEALYVGCIPIVIKNNIYNNWHDLPILQVNNYNDITQKILDSFLYKTYNRQKIHIEYWKDLINYT